MLLEWLCSYIPSKSVSINQEVLVLAYCPERKGHRRVKRRSKTRKHRPDLTIYTAQENVLVRAFRHWLARLYL